MKVIRYHTEDGHVIALLLEVPKATKWIKLIPMDSTGIRIRKVPVSEAQYFTELADYPLKRAKKIFRRATKRFNNELGSTPKALKEILQ